MKQVRATAAYSSAPKEKCEMSAVSLLEGLLASIMYKAESKSLNGVSE